MGLRRLELRLTSDVARLFPRQGLPGRSQGTLTPSQVSGLSVWLKADAGTFQDSAFTTPAVADGDPVGGWTDQSGTGNSPVQATNSKRGTLKLAIQNNLPVVRFDGVTQFVQKTFSATIAVPYTAFLVCIPRTVTGGVQGDVTDGVDTQRMEFQWAGATSNWSFSNGNGIGFGGNPAPHAVAGQAVILSGVTGNPGTARYNASTPNSGNVGTQVLGGITFAIDRGGSASPANVDICELLVYAAALTDIQQVMIINGLNSKWHVF